MKKSSTSILIIFILLLRVNSSFGQTNKMIASCCEGEMGRCTGSSYCTACTNCSRCKHCNSGGSCGVCSSGYTSEHSRSYSKSSSSRSSSSTYSKSTTTRKYTNSTYHLPNDVNSKNYLKKYKVKSLTLNLRSGPGTNYRVLEGLSENQQLVFLAQTGDWLKVRVVSTQTIGYVNKNFVGAGH